MLCSKAVRTAKHHAQDTGMSYIAWYDCCGIGSKSASHSPSMSFPSNRVEGDVDATSFGTPAQQQTATRRERQEEARPPAAQPVSDES